ncbi:MAG: hypothetical protein DRQ89_11590 [Epsilonproteobacteria bacterium]|nr:MAG: hypothetical protein DRQ89_11590 [Campylobacterota bacterium]
MKVALLLLLLSPALWSQVLTPELDAVPYRGPQAVKKEKVVVVKEKKSENGDDIDKEVTNARLRATSGSKSKWSMTFGFNYRGGMITDPFGLRRPDIYGNPENEKLTSFGGSISGRYRLNKKNSFTLGFGFSYLAPFRSDQDPERDQFNIDNPGVGYARIEKIGIFQISSGVDYIRGTSVAFKEQNLTGFLSFGITALTNFNESRFTLGLAFSFTDYFYSDDSSQVDFRTSYDLGFYPFFEFEFTKVWYFRTVLGFLNYEHVRSDDSSSPFSMQTTPHYVSVGIGIAITRDIYLYPNVQFLPKDLSTDNTNFALSATINVL